MLFFVRNKNQYYLHFQSHRNDEIHSIITECYNAEFKHRFFLHYAAMVQMVKYYDLIEISGTGYATSFLS